MREYAKVAPKFWIGKTGKDLRKQGIESLVVGMYLMTAPSANMLGLYYLPLVSLAHETGLGMEGALKGLRGAIEAGFCDYDEDAEMVWVYEMAFFQIGDQLEPTDKRCKGVQNSYEELPENKYLDAFFKRYSSAFCMTKSRQSTSPIEAPSKTLGSQEQEQATEQEQNKEQEKKTSQKNDGSPKPPKPEKSVNPDDLSIAEWMFERIKLIVPGAKEPNHKAWANDIRLLRERDNRSRDEICDLFEWANNHHFWSTNVLSPSKLREQWNKLSAQKAKPQGAVKPSIDDISEQRQREFLNEGYSSDPFTIDMQK